jgi:hypothetical protein
LADLLIGDAKTTAEKVIQIRNVAAIIQNNRPDVLLMAEYNNDGVGENKTALNGFQKVFYRTLILMFTSQSEPKEMEELFLILL